MPRGRGVASPRYSARKLWHKIRRARIRTCGDCFRLLDAPDSGVLTEPDYCGGCGRPKSAEACARADRTAAGLTRHLLEGAVE